MTIRSISIPTIDELPERVIPSNNNCLSVYITYKYVTYKYYEEIGRPFKKGSSGCFAEDAFEYGGAVARYPKELDYYLDKSSLIYDYAKRKK